jgi:hypothetical protein
VIGKLATGERLCAVHGGAQRDGTARFYDFHRLLNKPDGELITAAVEATSPPPYREDIELITTALKIAARTQRGEGIGRAFLTGGGVAAGVTLLIAVTKN